MRTFNIAVAALACVAVAHAMTYRATLDWKNENFGSTVVTAPGVRGTVALTINNDANMTFTGMFKLDKIDNMTMAHIHYGAAKTNGPVAVWLWPLDSSKPSVQPLTGKKIEIRFSGSLANSVVGAAAGNTTMFMEWLNARNLYVNMHSTQYPAGVTRGQLTKV
eukprot:CAMPEP_0202865816 /NCGR_PEP_ID=MMETSP1391-20130828/6397_1 /ASSEMBLY_ACC=CAM_ASM_000867 /TAXON_ID=1034604 /ORGANISM="Chlamydomonas leiostraca, Strain SAG 11-49" /LENGTH=162 /DNA_ID=CAMNT_0049545695 /DNA_START=54 /DNA_END=542 /DNA_ORIENTATION=+